MVRAQALLTLQEGFFYVAPLKILRSFDFNLQALESITYSFVRQPEMRLYEIVVLVLALCLVKYTKAESETDTETLRGEETFARDANLDSTAYLKEDPEKAAEEDLKIPTKQDAEEDIGKRGVTRQVLISISLPTNHIFKIFHIKFCFRRSCYGKRILVIRCPSLVLFCKNLMTKGFSVNCSMYPPSNFN